MLRGFPDTDSSVHGEAIEALADAGILQSYADGRFGTGDVVRRGQFVAILMSAYEEITGQPAEADGAGSFTDIAGSVHATAIRAASRLGVVEGVTPDRFEPDGEVARGQAASFLIRFYALESAD